MKESHFFTVAYQYAQIAVTFIVQQQAEMVLNYVTLHLGVREMVALKPRQDSVPEFGA